MRRAAAATSLPGAPRPRLLADPRADVEAYLRESNARVTRLYELDKLSAFGSTTNSEPHFDFAVDRPVAGAEMLRSLWWTAWVRRASPPA